MKKINLNSHIHSTDSNVKELQITVNKLIDEIEKLKSLFSRVVNIKPDPKNINPYNTRKRWARKKS